MPKSPKKSAKPALKSAAKKTAVKMKAGAKPKAKMKASVKPMAEHKGSRRGFMWKVLEQKQQKQKEQAMPGMTSVNPEERQRPSATSEGFARFHGPRRRVG